VSVQTLLLCDADDCLNTFLAPGLVGSTVARHIIGKREGWTFVETYGAEVSDRCPECSAVES
jgi:hypothetical protein